MNKTRAAAAITTMAVAAGGAAAALAIAPPPSSQFDGNTSQTGIQRHGVEVITNDAGQISTVYIQWRAKCKAKNQFWTSTSKIAPKGGLPLVGDVFKRTSAYTGDAGGGIKGRIKYALKGQFTDEDNVNGTWSAKVVVKRKGKKIDTCKLKKITWSATRSSPGPQG